MAKVKITQLFIYPVKSLAGIAVDHWPATTTGFKHDRQFMLVDDNNRFVTQRQEYAMALIHTSLEQQAVNNKSLAATDEPLPILHTPLPAPATLVLNYKGQAPQRLALDDKTLTPTSDQVFTAQIWSDDVQVFEPCDATSAWLSQALDKSVRLVALVAPRPQSQPERFGVNSHTVFADAAPYLIANQASLDTLNAELTAQSLAPVDMRRFRPNIVVQGELPAFSEHEFSKLKNNARSEQQFSLIDHCQRCVMTTIDPDLGTRDAKLEPFNTLCSINPMPATELPRRKAAPAFAVNGLLNGDDVQEISVGDNWSVD